MAERKLIIEIIGRDNASGPLRGVGSMLGNIATIAGGILTSQIFTRIGQEIWDFATGSIDAASDLSETINKTNEIFEGTADSLIKWAENSAQSVGLSKGAALDAASGFAVFGKAAGIAGDDLNDFSTENLTLAADMASFFNTSIDDAALAIQSAFRGETEPIRKYGVLLDDASLRAKALELGIISTTKNALTPQQRVLAANALIFEQTADAQGDFARTSDGYANQQRIFAAQIDNAKASLGEAFLPTLTDVMTFMNTTAIPVLQDVVGWVGGLVDAFKDTGSITSPEFLESLSSFLPQEMQDKFFAFVDGIKSTVDQFRPAFEGFINFIKINGPGISETIQTTFGKLLEIGKDLLDKVIPFLVEQFEKISAWFLENGPLIQDFVAVLSEVFIGVVTIIAGAWSFIQPILAGLVELILGLGKTIMQMVTGDWAGAWATLQSTVTTVGGKIWEGIVAFFDWIASWFGTSLEEIGTIWSENWEQFKQILQQVWEIITGFIDEKITKVKTAFDGIVTAIDETIGWLEDLAAAFLKIVIPEWLQFSSPTPLEMGLRGINDAMRELSKKSLPSLSSGFSGLSPALPMGLASAGAGVGSGTVGGGGDTFIIQLPMISMMDEQDVLNKLIPLIEKAKRRVS